MGRNTLFENTRLSIGDNGIASYARWVIAIIAPELLSACNVNNSGNIHNERNDNVIPEQPAVVVHIDSALASSAYPITNVSAGSFRIGAVIQDSLDRADVYKTVESKPVSDGKSIDMPVYTYHIGNEGWVKVTPQYDTASGQVSDKTGEIYIYSELFMTDKCIGAVSSLEEFACIYPDYCIRYIKEDDMFAIVTPQLPDVQFLLGSEHYIASGHDTTSISNRKLKISDFERNSYFDALSQKKGLLFTF